MSLLRELECPVCLDYMLEEISLCNNGHSVCQKCKNKLNSQKCPICKSGFIPGRNLSLEKIAKETMFKCKNSECHLKFKGKNIIFHELNCREGVHDCFLSFTQCTWKGKLHNIRDHINQEHKYLKGNWRHYGWFSTYVLFYDGDVFVIFRKNQDDHQIFAGMHVGIKKYSVASKYKFVLEYQDKTQRGFELYVAAPCISKRDRNEMFNSDKVVVSKKMSDILRCDINDIIVTIELNN